MIPRPQHRRETRFSLTREQIRKLFHCPVGSSSIDQALDKLSSLQLVASRYVTGRGRPTTVWFAIDPARVEPTVEEAAEPEESSEEADLPCLPCTF